MPVSTLQLHRHSRLVAVCNFDVSSRFLLLQPPFPPVLTGPISGEKNPGEERAEGTFNHRLPGGDTSSIRRARRRSSSLPSPKCFLSPSFEKPPVGALSSFTTLVSRGCSFFRMFLRISEQRCSEAEKFAENTFERERTSNVLHGVCSTSSIALQFSFPGVSGGFHSRSRTGRSN